MIFTEFLGDVRAYLVHPHIDRARCIIGVKQYGMKLEGMDPSLTPGRMDPLDRIALDDMD